MARRGNSWVNPVGLNPAAPGGRFPPGPPPEGQEQEPSKKEKQQAFCAVSLVGRFSEENPDYPQPGAEPEFTGFQKKG